MPIQINKTVQLAGVVWENVWLFALELFV
jgi:hypothetical protein